MNPTHIPFLDRVVQVGTSSHVAGKFAVTYKMQTVGELLNESSSEPTDPHSERSNTQVLQQTYDAKANEVAQETSHAVTVDGALPDFPPGQDRVTQCGASNHSSTSHHTALPARGPVPSSPFHSFPVPPCPTPGSGVNAWCLRAAGACRRHGLSMEEAAALIRAYITRPPQFNEVERALNKAYNGQQPANAQQGISEAYSEAELKALAHKIPVFGVDDLKRVSPIEVANCTPIQFLRYIFNRGERVILATLMTDRGTIWQNDPESIHSREDELDGFTEPNTGLGAWFLSNPVSGNSVKLERLKSEFNPSGQSLRSEENVTSFRYLVLESDDAPSDLWLRALAQLPLPIVSVTSSGGRSFHALVRLDAKNAEEWRAIKQRIAPALVTLGADRNALTAIRLTRLPGAYRAEKKQWQELLFLNPSADGTPICNLPGRSPLAGN